MNILLTGAANGLGKELATQLKQHPSVGHVFLLDIRAEHGIFGCDLSDPAQIRAFPNVVRSYKVKLNLIINCAGVACIDYVPRSTVYDWDYVMAVNARAPFLLTQAFLEDLADTGGAVINISSDAGHRAMTASLAYCASKAALDATTRVMARELWRRHDIAVFGVAPAKIANTPMSKYVDRRVCEVRGWTPEEAEKYHRSQMLMKEDIDPSILAEFIVSLAMDRSKWQYLNGQIIPFGG